MCVCVFTGFTEPGAIYRVDMAAEQPAPELFRQTKLKVSHNPSDYETHQVSLPDTRFPCQLDSKHFVLQHNGVHPLQQPPMHSLVDCLAITAGCCPMEHACVYAIPLS
jgi:hypothetical protein